MAPTGHGAIVAMGPGRSPGSPVWLGSSPERSQPAKSLQESLQCSDTDQAAAGRVQASGRDRGREDRVVSQAGDHPEAARTWGCGAGRRLQRGVRGPGFCYFSAKRGSLLSALALMYLFLFVFMYFSPVADFHQFDQNLG